MRRVAYPLPRPSPARAGEGSYRRCAKDRMATLDGLLADRAAIEGQLLELMEAP